MDTFFSSGYTDAFLIFSICIVVSESKYLSPHCSQTIAGTSSMIIFFPFHSRSTVTRFFSMFPWQILQLFTTFPPSSFTYPFWQLWEISGYKYSFLPLLDHKPYEQVHYLYNLKLNNCDPGDHLDNLQLFPLGLVKTAIVQYQSRAYHIVLMRGQ